jgi:hypothetical protein
VQTLNIARNALLCTVAANHTHTTNTQQLSGGAPIAAADDDDDDDAVSYEEWDEESTDSNGNTEDYESPVDNIDPAIHFYTTFRAAYQREPELYSRVQASLSAAAQAGCQELLKVAEEREQLAARVAADMGVAGATAGTVHLVNL